ncbi:MAG: hypothetical protein H7X71_06375 [Chitinophagales bacterium]|nr:hypothetical protein [Chitinophagales bacterium]
MFIKYLKKFLPFAAVIAIILIAINFIESVKPVMTFAWICFGLFFVMSIVTHYFSGKSMQGRFANFMNVFFAGIIVKLIITGIVVVIYKTQNPDTRSLLFIIPFAIIYFSFLIFDTFELVKLSQSTNRKSS